MSERTNYPSIGETIDGYLERQESAIESIKTEDEIEDIAYEILSENEYSKYLRNQIERIRANRGDDSNLVEQQRKLFNEIKIELALISGVEIDAVEHARQRSEYKNRIKKTLAAVDKDASDEDIMVALGLLEESEEIRGEGGERYYRFTFSPNIFPPYVQQEWDAYMDMVGQFEVASQRLKEGVLSQAEFSGVDLIRKKAHNTVSQSIGDILDFDGWELEDYRRFAAKMRDKQAAKSMGELARYADGFKEFYDEHLSTMSKKIRNHR